MDSAWTARLRRVLCTFELLRHVICARVYYIDLGPADGWRYLRLFSPRRLPLQTLRTLYASQYLASMMILLCHNNGCQVDESLVQVCEINV
jgi:hypothetical protein